MAYLFPALSDMTRYDLMRGMMVRDAYPMLQPVGWVERSETYRVIEAPE
jgi:hypothetical protein